MTVIIHEIKKNDDFQDNSVKSERNMLRDFEDTLTGMQNGGFRAEPSGGAERKAWKSQKWPSVVSTPLLKCV